MIQRVILYCGEIRNWDTHRLSLAAALALRNRGLITRILVSTWIGELENYPSAQNFYKSNGIEILETNFPSQLIVKGNVFQQMLTLDRALNQLDDATLVLRTRPDIIVQDVRALETLLVQDLFLDPELVPRFSTPIFKNKIWIPFFIPAYPFFYADNIFMGYASDLRLLVNYDMFTEAHGVESRPIDGSPMLSSGAAAEIRRYLFPFQSIWPILREYQLVWPKHSIGTEYRKKVLSYNINSTIYREYFSLSLYAIFLFFSVGLREAAGKILLDRSYLDPPALNRILIKMDKSSSELKDYLSFDSESFAVWSMASYSSSWVDNLFLRAPEDDYSRELIFDPLRRALSYTGNSERRAMFDKYISGLYDVSNSALP